MDRHDISNISTIASRVINEQYTDGRNKLITIATDHRNMNPANKQKVVEIVNNLNDQQVAAIVQKVDSAFGDMSPERARDIVLQGIGFTGRFDDTGKRVIEPAPYVAELA